jgi:phage recombination protein Bet
VSKHPIFAKMAERFRVDESSVMEILKATAFKQQNGSPVVTDAQMVSLLIVADQYGLNPFTREIFAFPDKGAIVPVVGLDGWSRIINDHPQYDGCEIRYSDEMFQVDTDSKKCHAWVEVSMFRKDRAHPTTIREYLDEVYKPRAAYPDGNKKPAGHWQTHTKRALRHKGLIQCARVAFGFGGIYDEDEAHRIVDSGVVAEIEEVQNEFMPRSKTKAVTSTPGQTIEGTSQVVEPEKVTEEPGRPVAPEPARNNAGDGRDSPADPGPLLQEGAKKTLLAAMARAGKTEQWLADEFSVTTSTMPFSLFNTVMAALRK